MVFKLRYGLLLTNILPEHRVCMSLALKVGSQGFDSLAGREQSLEMPQTLLLLLELSHNLHVVFTQSVKAFQEGGDAVFLLCTELRWVSLVLVRGGQLRILSLEPQRRLRWPELCTFWILGLLAFLLGLKTQEAMPVLLLLVILHALAVKYSEPNEMQSIAEQHRLDLLVVRA